MIDINGAGIVRLRLSGIRGLRAQVRAVIQVTMQGDRYALDKAHFEIDRIRKQWPELVLQVDEDPDP